MNFDLRHSPLDIYPGSEREPRVLVCVPADGMWVDGLGRHYHGGFQSEHLVRGMGVAVLRISPGMPSDEIVAMARRGRRQVIVNTIADPDLHPAALKVVAEIARHFPTINDPSQILRHGRERVADALKGIDGLVVPRCLRFDDTPPSGEDFIYRQAGTSTGLSMTRDLAEFEPGAENYATEFVDYRSPDGLYRKYRVRMIGGEAIPNHLFLNRDWKVHGKSSRDLMAEHKWMRDEEERFLTAPLPKEHLRIFRAIDRRIGVDHYGIDYSMLPGGRLVLFEANAGMRSFYPEWRETFPATVVVTRRLIDKFAELVRRKAGLRT